MQFSEISLKAVLPKNIEQQNTTLRQMVLKLQQKLNQQQAILQKPENLMNRSDYNVVTPKAKEYLLNGKEFLKLKQDYDKLIESMTTIRLSYSSILQKNEMLEKQITNQQKRETDLLQEISQLNQQITNLQIELNVAKHSTNIARADTMQNPLNTLGILQQNCQRFNDELAVNNALSSFKSVFSDIENVELNKVKKEVALYLEQITKLQQQNAKLSQQLKQIYLISDVESVIGLKESNLILQKTNENLDQENNSLKTQIMQQKANNEFQLQKLLDQQQQSINEQYLQYKNVLNQQFEDKMQEINVSAQQEVNQLQTALQQAKQDLNSSYQNAMNQKQLNKTLSEQLLQIGQKYESLIEKYQILSQRKQINENNNEKQIQALNNKICSKQIELVNLQQQFMKLQLMYRSEQDNEIFLRINEMKQAVQNDILAQTDNSAKIQYNNTLEDLINKTLQHQDKKFLHNVKERQQLNLEIADQIQREMTELRDLQTQTNESKKLNGPIIFDVDDDSQASNSQNEHIEEQEENEQHQGYKQINNTTLITLQNAQGPQLEQYEDISLQLLKENDQILNQNNQPNTQYKQEVMEQNKQQQEQELQQKEQSVEISALKAKDENADNQQTTVKETIQTNATENKDKQQKASMDAVKAADTFSFLNMSMNFKNEEEVAQAVASDTSIPQPTKSFGGQLNFKMIINVANDYKRLLIIKSKLDDPLLQIQDNRNQIEFIYDQALDITTSKTFYLVLDDMEEEIVGDLVPGWSQTFRFDCNTVTCQIH